MAKIMDFENPVTGTKGNFLNASDWTKNIIGVGFLFMVFSVGQQIAKMVSGKVPFVSSTIQDPIQRPQTDTGPKNKLYGIR